MRQPVHRSALLVPILLAGCSFAPKYDRPRTQTEPAVFQEDGSWRESAPTDTQQRGPWWELFADPELNALESRVTQANQDLKAAFARLQQARAQTRIERSAYFPTINLNSSATRGRSSVDAPGYVAGSPASGNDFTLEADLSYEFDVWGRIRNSVAAARASAQASAADLAALDLSTHAELASDYFTLRSLDAQQALLNRTVAAYQAALDLTQNLYNGGAAVLSDLNQAQAQVASARTQAADLGLRRAQTEHAIAVLIGESASTFQLSAQPLRADKLPPRIDPGLPSTLLERRPDVAAAERRVAAANAQIGVARAAYFPVFSLSAGAGFESTRTSDLITAPARLWSIGPSALLNLFDGGLRRAQSASVQAAYEAQVAQYRGTVLNAYQEVEDNLAALRQLELESATEAAAVQATAGALEQAQYRFRGGIVTYLEVTVAENAALTAQLSAADIQIRRLTASVLLVKALGGGWEENRTASRLLSAE